MMIPGSSAMDHHFNNPNAAIDLNIINQGGIFGAGVFSSPAAVWARTGHVRYLVWLGNRHVPTKPDLFPPTFPVQGYHCPRRSRLFTNAPLLHAEKNIADCEKKR